MLVAARLLLIPHKHGETKKTLRQKKIDKFISSNSIDFIQFFLNLNIPPPRYFFSMTPFILEYTSYSHLVNHNNISTYFEMH